MSNLHSLEVVDRGSEAQRQVGQNSNDLIQRRWWAPALAQW